MSVIEPSIEAVVPSPMPAVFFGHGSPMNALEQNRYTESWRAFGQSVPTPRAILVVSAHWYIHATAITAMGRPRTIHDFYGFPQELFDVEYPAPGDEQFAEEVAEIAKPTWIGLDHDSWGLDHGTWSVLVHAFPEADIPVLQLSVNAEKPLDYHVDLGAQLGALRARGVLIVGSGNVVHNLGRLDWSTPDAGYDWARRFNTAAIELLADEPGDAASLGTHPDFQACAPTPDHFIPMLYVAGVAADADRALDVLIDGYAMGSLSMTSFTVDGHVDRDDADSVAGAAALPDPTVVPADQTNA